jgi:hypothetical protein
MDAARAKRELVRGLQLAYSGELGAAWAYLGHRHSLRHGADRRAIHKILVDEVHHRRALLAMLRDLGSGSDRACERKMTLVGRSIGVFCHVGGWFLPMYGAARLEADNVVEYEILARIAWYAGRHDLIETLLGLAEVEWDHEERLRTLAAAHRLWRWMPHWPVPPPRARIRARFAEFVACPVPVERRRSLLMR